MSGFPRTAWHCASCDSYSGPRAGSRSSISRQSQARRRQATCKPRGGCDIQLARRIGAELAITGTVQKVSKAPARPGLSLSLCASSGFSGGASISWGPFSGAARCRQFCDRKTTLDEFFKSSRLAAPQLSQFFFTKHNWTHRCRCVNRGGCSVHRMADNRLRPRGGSSVLRSPILKWRPNLRVLPSGE
jgi:hypothetical protein